MTEGEEVTNRHMPGIEANMHHSSKHVLLVTNSNKKDVSLRAGCTTVL